MTKKPKIFTKFYVYFRSHQRQRPQRGQQRPNSKYRPNCWAEDPNDQPPPIFSSTPYQERSNRRLRRRRQVPCLWELEATQEHEAVSEAANNY